MVETNDRGHAARTAEPILHRGISPGHHPSCEAARRRLRKAGRPVAYAAHAVKPDYFDAQFPYPLLVLAPWASRGRRAHLYRRGHVGCADPRRTKQASTVHATALAAISAAAEKIRRGGAEPSDHTELTARLDQLASVRRVTQIGAAIGHEFLYVPLRAAPCPFPEDELQAALARLVASEPVFRRGAPPAAVYSFKRAACEPCPAPP